MTNSAREHFFYWLLPSLVVLAMVLMFFSGNTLWRTIVAPAIGREFGVLENLQAVLLLVAVAFSVRGIRRSLVTIERGGFILLMLACAFLLLEEINYGEHYWKLLTGQSLEPVGRGNEFNLHNKISTSPIKSAANLVLLVVFVLMPLLVRQTAPAWLRYLAPPRLLVITVFCSVALSQLAHQLDDISGEVDHVLGNNIAEFREVFIYYIGMMYVYTLAYRRSWPGWHGEFSRPASGQARGKPE
jgi:hypothetical protein